MRRALFELALDAKSVDAVKADLDRFDAHDRRERRTCTRLVRSPVFGAEEQSKALAAVLDKAGIGGLAANFLHARGREPPAVRGARHDPRLPRRWSPSARAR